jgi:DNA polymerase III delta prime subunit
MVRFIIGMSLMNFSDLDIPPKSNALLASYCTAGLSTKILTLCGSNKDASLSVAERLSRYHLCHGVKDTNCPCYDCRLGADHPDLMIIKPSVSGRILVADLAAALNFLKETSLTSDKRCLVIKDASGFVGGASADLLKIFEERLDGVLVILVAQNREKIPPTIRSRSSVVFTGDLDKSTAMRKLLAGGISGKKAEDLSRIASQVTKSVVDNADEITESIATAQYILGHIFKNSQAKAVDRAREFMEAHDDSGVNNLLEVMLVCTLDIQKARMTAQSQLSVQSRLDWYTSIRDFVTDDTLSKTSFAIRKALGCMPQHRRAMLVWVLGALSAVIETLSKEIADAKK